MPLDEFAPQFPLDYPINGCFTVLNIINNSNKTIRIFHYPIPVGMARDLLRIPGVAEADIRASLLKGELRNKLIAKEIRVICSDIDLLQFNDEQKQFLLAGGVVKGLSVDGYAGSGITAEQHATLRQLIHFIDQGPGDGFASGAFKTVTPTGSPFPTNITWWLDGSLTQKLVEKLITYNSHNVPSTIVWHMYDTDGVTLIHTVTDNFTYVNNVFENSRFRSIS